MNTEQIHYTFGEELQQEILQFAVTDIKNGFKAVELFESHFFVSLEHIIIAEALKKYYGTRYAIPSLAVLDEEIKNMLRHRNWKQHVKPQDKANVTKLIKRLYRKPVKNPDEIYKICRNFSRYCALKEVLENVDLNNFNDYESIEEKVHKARTIGTELNQDKGTFILADAQSRVVRRRDTPPGYPTPWRQLNAIMNSGGTNIGNVIVVLGPAKRFKTGFLLNTARGYLKKGQVIVVFDYENGEEALSMRADQSILNIDRKGLLGGLDSDKKLLKQLRLYKRFGGELIIKRMPAGSTTADQAIYLKWLKDNHGLIADHILVDYPDVMGDSLKQSDETKRIGQVYIDLKNLGQDFGIKSIWCPSHVTREGDKSQSSKYKATDLSKAIDKVRHADMILGIQQDEEEKELDIIRMELIDQRDGIGEGRIWLHGSMATQRVKEFSSAQVREMEEYYKEKMAGAKGEPAPVGKKKEPKVVSDL